MATATPTKRWLDTGYFRSPPTEGVDRENGIIKGCAVNTVGEAKGHGVSLDEEFVQDVCKLGAFKRHGLKARFGHPNMCSTALGTYIGRFRNFRLGESERDGEMRPATIADLHLSETAKNAPAGDLYTYMLDMAENEPDMFGTSIVFTPGPQGYRRDSEGEKVYEDEEGFEEIGGEVFTEIRKLHACDAVDEPAANDGLFSAFSGDSLAGQVTQFLDLNPGLWDALKEDPTILEALSIRGEQVDEFVSRYSAYREEKSPSAGTSGNENQEAPDMDLETILTSESFINLCDGIDIPEDADEAFVLSVFATANENIKRLGELSSAVEHINAETDAALEEANEKIAKFEAEKKKDEEPDIASLSDSDDPAVQALLAQNAEQQKELDDTSRELSEKRTADDIKSVNDAKAEAELAAADGKLNEEGVEALTALLSAEPTDVIGLTEEGTPFTTNFDVAGTARKLIESLKPNAALDLGERTVRKLGNEDQTLAIVSNEKDQDELSDEKVKEHAARMAASIGQGQE